MKSDRFELNKNRIIQEYSEKEKHLEAVYSEGMLTAGELRERKISLYCELREALSREEGGSGSISEEDLLNVCGLSPKDLGRDILQKDLGFDPLKDGEVYIFKGLKDVESLWRETEMDGKCFSFQIPLSSDGKTVWEAFQFTVLYMRPGTENQEGWTVYRNGDEYRVVRHQM